MKDFILSFRDTTKESNRPFLQIYQDDARDWYNDGRAFRHMFFGEDQDGVDVTSLRNKHSLTQLWNRMILDAPTDWVLVMGDDAVFKAGWVYVAKDRIQNSGAKFIGLLHFGAFLFHKSLFLDMGYFDESFEGGGWEDIDWQLRWSEAGIVFDVYDKKDDFKFLQHARLKYQHDQTGHWQLENNEDWFREKWNFSNYDNYHKFHVFQKEMPCVRMRPEVDWHPAWTKKLEKKFGYQSKIPLINEGVQTGKKVLIP